RDAFALRHCEHGAGRGVAFDDLADLAQCRVRRRSTREQQAEATVARLVVGAGQYQVTESGESHEGFAARTERDAEAHHLREPARDQRDARIGAEAETVREARTDREHVLDGATRLDT